MFEKIKKKRWGTTQQEDVISKYSFKYAITTDCLHYFHALSYQNSEKSLS